MRGIRDWGLGIGRRRKAEGGRRQTRRRPLIPNPQSPIPASRSGITLLEVLVSIFILSVGLLGVAALIPIGKLALIKTNISDRTGACGRAAMRDVEVRRMLNCYTWLPPVDPDGNLGAIALDPLGYLGVGIGPLGGASSTFPRYTFNGTLTLAQADAIFRWQDDLPFVQDATINGDRPVLAGTTSEGNFSWFLTVCPSPSDIALGTWVNLRRNYTVSVVVCYKRDFTGAGEHPVAVSSFLGGGYGGGTIQLDQNVSGFVKTDQWVMLASTDTRVAKWYRVVGVGDQYLSLVGPDWDTLNYPTPTMVVVEGVTGVYTTTVHLDADCIWSR